MSWKNPQGKPSIKKSHKTAESPNYNKNQHNPQNLRNDFHVPEQTNKSIASMYLCLYPIWIFWILHLLDWWYLTGPGLHILVVSYYAKSNIHQRVGLRSAFCLYGTCFHFFGATLFLCWQTHAGNNAAAAVDKCRGRQIQQIQVINPTNLAARGNLAPIGAWELTMAESNFGFFQLKFSI